MSWEDIKSPKPGKENEKRKEQAIKLAKNYANCFGTEDGKAVLQHMVDSFIMGNDTPFNSPNVNYEAAYHDGEAGTVKFILNQIKKAQTL